MVGKHERSEDFRTIAFPKERRLVLDTLHLGHRKPMMHGLLEVEITAARALLAEYKASVGEALSFTAFVLACLGRAAAAHPEVHGRRDWRGRIALFERVDATVLVEVQVEGRPFALAHVMRDTDRRGVRDLSAELRAVQGGGIRSLSPVMRVVSRLFLSVPGFLRRWIYGLLLRSPRRAARYTGTVLVTAVGMFGGVGWGLSAPGLHELSLVVGGMARRPTPEVPAREVLCLTISANHELVDGAPLARFGRRLTELLESGELLREALAEAGVARRGVRRGDAELRHDSPAPT